MENKKAEKIKYNRKTCLMCGSELNSEPLMIFENMPASAQDIPEAFELSEDRGIELRLFKCPFCGLFQFDCEPVDYYRDVIRAVGLSETMRELRRADYRHMIEDYGLKDGRFLECGCGRGEFLQVLKEVSQKAYGTENNRQAAEAAEKAIGKGHIFCGFPETGEEIFFGGGFDCFFSFNFLEHQPDPRSMLRSMYKNLRSGGYGLITVPSFEYILKEGRYYEFIRDHIANYSLEALERLCIISGFEVLEKGYIGIGDTLRVIVRKPEYPDAKTEIKLEEDGELSEGIERLKKNRSLIGESVRAFTDELKEKGMKLCLWGAGHQGFTIASTTSLKEEASYIIDSAPFKQGKFAPASHIPIVGPEHFRKEPSQAILIVAPGYAREINETIRRSFSGLKDEEGREIRAPRVFKLSSDHIEEM